jgi:hypothetical protein
VAAGAEVIVVPAYPPDFNPIKMMGSKIKSILRSLEARTVCDLITRIGQALARITPKDLVNWFAHCGYRFC